MTGVKAQQVVELLTYATNQEVEFWVQCPKSEFIFHFKTWDVLANISTLDLFAQPAEKVANDVLAQLYKKNELPSFIEPKDVVVTVSPDLTKFYESFKPVEASMKAMANKLGEAYSELNTTLVPFTEKLKELVDAINNSASNDQPAQYVMQNEDINQKVHYPCTCVYGDTKANLRSVIMHLNDMHKWSRERIADWLDTLPSQPIYYPNVEVESA